MLALYIEQLSGLCSYSIIAIMPLRQKRNNLGRTHKQYPNLQIIINMKEY